MTNREVDEVGIIPVVAAVIRRGDRLLVARRPEGKRHGGLWEFPGGKILEGESVAAALARELREELGIEVARAGSELFRARDPGSAFSVRFVEVVIRGEPRPLEHTELAWCDPDRLRRLPLAPTDLRFVAEALAPPPADSVTDAPSP